MKKANNSVLDVEYSSELDKLVLDELDAMEQEKSEGKQYKDIDSAEDIDYDEMETKKRFAKRKKLKQRSKVKDETDYFDQDFETEFEDADMLNMDEEKREAVTEEEIWEEPDNGLTESGDDILNKEGGLLDKDEEEFVANTVNWLKSRDNKDSIVAKIWSLLTETEPQSFYSVESVEAGKVKDQSGITDSSEEKIEPDGKSVEK